MSDSIKHECGIALIRLLKPLDFYVKKYGTSLYGVNKLYLLMEKQHNRGQDGAGVASIKLDMKPGERYISRHRSISSQPIVDIFKKIHAKYKNKNGKKLSDGDSIKRQIPFAGELMLGHLRYGTQGKNKIEGCHPFLRQNNWMTKNLIVAGNFNLTNVDELFQQLVEIGQHPKESVESVTILEKIGHFLDDENEQLYNSFRAEGYSKKEITQLIASELNIQRILARSAKDFDGGYVIAGLIGHGDAFVLRDPSGIRPAFYYKDDEVVVVASERPPIQTAFNVEVEDIKEITPGHALVIKKDGATGEMLCHEPHERRSCSFERIYFSRGNDIDIYKERKKLGYLLSDSVLEAIDHDVKNTVFSFIPNTAEVAYHGLIEGIEDYLNDYKRKKIFEIKDDLDMDKLQNLLDYRTRVEKAAIKDLKLRTFITEDASREDLVRHVYDITYGSIRKGVDTLVIVDDSIVRGTTLEKSILSILDRLGPKKIVIVSSAPQIRYPDCYGIDMSRMNDFVAFRAAIKLAEETGQEQILDEIYAKCKANEGNNTSSHSNEVKKLYDLFEYEQVSQKIAEIIKSKEIKAEIVVVYQTIENLHKACPDHKGDWYFTGDFPTPGGNKVVNKAYMNFREGKNARAYEEVK